MKRIGTGILAAVICAAMLGGCGGKPAKEPAAADVVMAVSGELTLVDSMMTLEDGAIENIYNLDLSKLADKACYVSATRGTAEEISVFRVKDAGDMQMVKDAIAERIEDQKISYESYNPAEMVKINGALTLTEGDYAILVMADDVSKVEDTFRAQFVAE